MKELTKIEIIELLSKHNEKFYIYTSGWDLSEYSSDEIFGAFPALKDGYENEEINSQALYDGYVILEFDTFEEMDLVFKNIVGDDGSETNNYSGNLRIYAITIYDGYAQNVNT